VSIGIDTEENKVCFVGVKVFGDLFNSPKVKDLKQPPENCPYILEHTVAE
jgi:hypothetical protein